MTKRNTTVKKSHKARIREIFKKPREKFLNNSQKDYWDVLGNNEITLCFGPAGVGKSFIAMKRAVDLLWQEDNKYEKILIVRPAVEVAVSVDGTNALTATQGGGSTTICANTPYAMTLLAINQGTGPMTFVYNVRANNINGTILQSNVSSGAIAAGGTIYSAAAGALSAGTYFK